MLKPLLIGAAILSVASVASYTAYNNIRGIKNNNPGNIRHGENWDGQAPTQTDASYVQFISPEYGIRALFKNLLAYRTKLGLSTIRQIINRWAPPNENDTTSYVANVAKFTGYNPDDVLPMTAYPELLKAIIRQENGVQPYSDDIILRGISMA